MINNNDPITSLNEKLYFIAYFLDHFSLPECWDSIDISDKEVELLSEDFSIRFKKTGSEYFCYYSSLPGKSGVGGTMFLAFCYMLNNLGFKLTSEGSLYIQLKRHFDKT